MLKIAETSCNRALLWVFAGALAISLIGCANVGYKPNTAKEGYGATKAKCEAEVRQLSVAEGALWGAGASALLGVLLTGSTSAGDLIVGGAVGGGITHLDTQDKIKGCLKARGY